MVGNTMIRHRCHCLNVRTGGYFFFPEGFRTEVIMHIKFVHRSADERIMRNA